jgi:peptidoglycan/LPS O-acetylase OafA/YrhL
MWMVYMRSPKPEMAYWEGRVGLAMVDAIAWPLAWIALVMRLPHRGSALGMMVVVICVLAALSRLHTAAFENHHYRFTTWRWAKLVGGLMLVGAVMKVMLALGT